MDRRKVELTYFYHSGFMAQIDHCSFIFDFYRGHVSLQARKTYVFVSHSHGDHYNPEIFNWQKPGQDVHYILSNDISGDPHIPSDQDNVTFISPGEEVQIDDVKVRAYGSTDEGVSFLVQFAGINIFHAGDLNWWDWAEDTPENRNRAEQDFKREVGKMSGVSIDLAFFPVDPRLQPNHCIGAEWFINEIKPRFFIPIHFWEDYRMIAELKDRIGVSPTLVIELTNQDQKISLQIEKEG